MLFSRLEAFKKGLRVKLFREDLWKHNLKRYDNVVIFGVEQMVIIVMDSFRRDYFCLIFF